MGRLCRSGALEHVKLLCFNSPVDSLTTYDGLRLHLQRWPARGTPRGTVQILHGLGEHGARYGALAAELSGAGWQVVAHDLRGHGLSDGARGSIPLGAGLLADVATVMDHVRSDGPLVLLGHSMGGVLAARFVAEGLSPRPASWHRGVDGLVLSSPALDAGLNGFEKLLLSVLGPAAPNLRLSNGLKPGWISRDPATVTAYVADPLVHDRVTPRLVQFIVDSGEFVLERAWLWRVPTLLMWSGADRCVAPTGSATLAARAPTDLLTARKFDGLFHEIFNEPERDQVLACLARWLTQLQKIHPLQERRA